MTYRATKTKAFSSRHYFVVLIRSCPSNNLLRSRARSGPPPKKRCIWGLDVVIHADMLVKPRPGFCERGEKLQSRISRYGVGFPTNVLLCGNIDMAFLADAPNLLCGLAFFLIMELYLGEFSFVLSSFPLPTFPAVHWPSLGPLLSYPQSIVIHSFHSNIIGPCVFSCCWGNSGTSMKLSSIGFLGFYRSRGG